MRVIWSSLVLLTIWLGHRGRLASAEGKGLVFNFITNANSNSLESDVLSPNYEMLLEQNTEKMHG